MYKISFKMFLWILALSFTIFLANSCKNLADVNPDGNDLKNVALKNGATAEGLLEYYNFYKTPTKGNVNIRDYATWATQNDRIAEIKGYYFGQNNTLIDGGQIKVGNVILQQRSKEGYDTSPQNINDFYGKTTKFNLGLPDGTAIEDSIYVPNSLVLTSPEYQNLMEIEEGTTLSWVSDIKSEKDVIFIVQYSPNELNEGFKKQGYNQRIVNVINVKDSKGSYSIGADLIKNIPSGAYVDILIGRANFKFLQSFKQETYSIYAYSTITSLCKMR